MYRKLAEGKKGFFEKCLDLHDMQRLNAQSFSKSLDKWDIDNAPVAGNAFAKYYAIAEMMESA